ncbi:MAG: alpha/beta hydrolase family protein [Chroococcidiopsis sp.]
MMNKQVVQLEQPCASTLMEYANAPHHYAGIAGVPPEIAVRLPGFAAFGVDGERLVEAVRVAGPEIGPATPGWATKMIEYGDAALVQAEQAEEHGRHSEAVANFLEASFWYFFARFPHIINPDGLVAYHKHKIVYQRAAQYFDPPLEVVAIPHSGGTMSGYLRVPTDGAARLPLVVLWGGIDVWKSDLEIHNQSEALLLQGIATLALDMPGTGESPIPVSIDAEQILFAAIEMMRADERIDSNCIGCYGLSFGGHWAVKLAIQHPELIGAVQVAGPVHETFQPLWVSQLPRGTKLALAKVLGLNPNDPPEQLLSRLAELSLLKQGLFPAQQHAPLLSINGADDELVSISEFDLLTTQGVQHDRLIFAKDRHVASRNWKLHELFVADWFKQRLSVLR